MEALAEMARAEGVGADADGGYRIREFHFEQRIVNGVQEPLPRWMRCTAAVDSSLGEALGEVFVKKHFPPAAKQRMNDLVENIRATLREELENATWMNPQTRKNAVHKLNSFHAKIGYPERWHDYGQVKVRRDNFLDSSRSADLAFQRYRLAKIGKPLDRNDWGMTPPTVNAYYMSSMNEIVFPPEFFSLRSSIWRRTMLRTTGRSGRSSATRWGMGSMIRGSKFDGSGNLQNCDG
jgi:predicted metalloendopeptidase